MAARDTRTALSQKKPGATAEPTAPRQVPSQLSNQARMLAPDSPPMRSQSGSNQARIRAATPAYDAAVIQGKFIYRNGTQMSGPTM